MHIVDLETNSYRDSTAQDLYNAARLTQHLDNVHFFQRAMVCRDVLDNFQMDINTLYACCAGTTKHVGTSFSDPSHVDGCFDLLHMIAGGEDAWRARPFVSNSNCFVVPPMKFATESCQTMEACIRAGMPVLLLSAGQAGATAPAPIALAIVQAVAECLAGVVYVNAMAPGHPAIFGTWPFVSDLRTGAMSGGSAEQALLTAGCAQMHQFYGLPGGAAAGIADSKLPDMQAGWEQGISNVLAGLSGLNMVYEAVGMHASLLGFCLESLVLGDDMLGQVMRCVRGIDVTEDSVSIEAMRAGLPRRPRSLPRLLADAGADADRIYLPRDRQPHEPQGMGRGGQARPSPRGPHKDGPDPVTGRTAGRSGRGCGGARQVPDRL